MVHRATQGSNNCEICPLPLIVGTFLLAERRTGSLFSLFLNSRLVVSYVLLAGCQMDYVPFCSGWDLEKPRAMKGLDPFTQPPHRQAGRAPCRRESGLEDKFSGKMVSEFMQRQLLPHTRSHYHVNIWVRFTPGKQAPAFSLTK